MNLSGRRCQCAGCGQYFNSESAFNAHRVGNYAIKRECLTTPQMEAKGMAKNKAQFWVTELREEGHYE
jgi:hypothetical protein